MNRFRSGRPATPWAGGQTGPMTVDVEALMASRNLDPVPRSVNEPVKYVSPLTAYADYARNAANTHTPLAEASPAAETALAAEAAETIRAERASASTTELEPDEPTGPVTVKLVYVGPGSEQAAKEAENLSERPPTQLQRLSASVHALAAEAGLAHTLVAEATPEATAIAPKRSHHKRKRPKRKPRPAPAAKQLTVRPFAPRPQSQPKSQHEIDLSRHQRCCTICRHPDRDAIEEAFLQWRNIRVIEHEWEIDDCAIYRHAHALKLFKQRNLSLRSALEFVIEKAEHIQPTAEGLVKAIRAYTRINDQGEWIDTPTTHIVKVMPMLNPEPRNVTPVSPDEGRDTGRMLGSGEGRASNQTNAAGTVTLDVKKISDCPREGRVQVTVESPSGRPLLTESAPQVEFPATPSKQRRRKFLTEARTHIRIFGKLANSVSKIWRRRAR